MKNAPAFRGIFICIELFESESQLYRLVVRVSELLVSYLAALYFDVVGYYETVDGDLEVGLGIPG
jgi:hypothetical protein